MGRSTLEPHRGVSPGVTYLTVRMTDRVDAVSRSGGPSSPGEKVTNLAFVK